MAFRKCFEQVMDEWQEWLESVVSQRKKVTKKMRAALEELVSNFRDALKEAFWLEQRQVVERLVGLANLASTDEFVAAVNNSDTQDDSAEWFEVWNSQVPWNVQELSPGQRKRQVAQAEKSSNSSMVSDDVAGKQVKRALCDEQSPIVNKRARLEQDSANKSTIESPSTIKKGNCSKKDFPDTPALHSTAPITNESRINKPIPTIDSSPRPHESITSVPTKLTENPLPSISKPTVADQEPDSQATTMTMTDSQNTDNSASLVEQSTTRYIDQPANHSAQKKEAPEMQAPQDEDAPESQDQLHSQRSDTTHVYENEFSQWTETTKIADENAYSETPTVCPSLREVEFTDPTILKPNELPNFQNNVSAKSTSVTRQTDHVVLPPTPDNSDGNATKKTSITEKMVLSLSRDALVYSESHDSDDDDATTLCRDEKVAIQEFANNKHGPQDNDSSKVNQVGSLDTSNEPNTRNQPISVEVNDKSSAMLEQVQEENSNLPNNQTNSISENAQDSKVVIPLAQPTGVTFQYPPDRLPSVKDHPKNEQGKVVHIGAMLKDPSQGSTLEPLEDSTIEMVEEDEDSISDVKSCASRDSNNYYDDFPLTQSF